MILVTGGAGFIGSHLVDRLIDMGKDVLVVDNFYTGTKDNLNPKANLWQHGESLVNINKYEHNLLNNIEVIFHLGALSRVKPSYELALENYDVNSTGTMMVLEVARKRKCRVVYAGSSTAYHDLDANPYAYTKWLGEQHCKTYSLAYGVPTAIARFFLVYGPRQINVGDYANVVGIFERAKKCGLPLTVGGDGSQRRDFIHVHDVVEGLIQMAEGDHWRGEVFNLGTGKTYSIKELADMFGGPQVTIARYPRDADNLECDLSLTHKYLPNWKPTHDIKDYIANLG